jgi:hypothetical protein
VRNLLWLLVLAALFSLGSSPSPRPGGRTSTTATGGARPVGPTGIVLPAADPMTAELQRELERGQRDYAGLFQRLALAHSESEALEIEDDMRQQRVELQISLLRIQSAYARRAGRNGFADQLERAISALIAAEPAPPAGPGGGRKL